MSKKIVPIRMSDELIIKIQSLANRDNEGNFSKQTRDLIRLGIKSKKDVNI